MGQIEREGEDIEREREREGMQGEGIERKRNAKKRMHDT